MVETLNTHETANSLYSMLGTGLLFYEGRYWLAENYNAELYGGGWFASPIYETENGLEVRPAGGNWCYKSNGAIEAQSLNNEQMKQIYQSWIKHLDWTCKMIEKYPDEINKLQTQADYFRGLLLACA